ncbi:hypothetical protein DID88_000406 [Monilinia fructigena]|uniref:Uncharacterized protein n=1 Tax=Monilinia fructigena TaxID=38457 RepID=A0A395IHF4_9HELO|nr:hypothetical protein DID88_000406 [Monilinia fructigena]
MATISTSQAHTSLNTTNQPHRQTSTIFKNHHRQASRTNGHALHPSTETFGPNAVHDYNNYLAPVGANELNRQHSDISDTHSAPGSLLDLYGNSKSGQSMDSGERRGMNGGNFEMDDAEHDRWIHRDKLARIENEELQAAGITVPRPRTASKSSRRDRSQDHGNGIKSEGQKRQKVGANSIGDGEGSNAWDLRLPEEAAGDLGTKGISKIPISKSSPLPIPIDYLERDTPIPRKNGGNYDDNDPLSFKQARSRSHSIKSSLVLDDAISTSANVPVPTPARAIKSTRKYTTPRFISSPPDEPEEPEEQQPEESTSEWPLTGPRSPPPPISTISPASPTSPASAITPKSPTLSAGARSQGERIGSYSTMPKIATGKPQGVHIPDPKPPIRVQDSLIQIRVVVVAPIM